jgi:transcriptional regulator with XRE-family HTH domain
MATLTGNKLAALLKERGMSQKELAEAACLTPASVSRYVNGEREPRVLTVAALADVLGVKPSDIIGTSDEQEMDTAVSFIVRNIDKLTEAQRAELIAALSKL